MQRTVDPSRALLIVGLLASYGFLLSPPALKAETLPKVIVTGGDHYLLYEPFPGTNFNPETMPLVVYLHGAPWFIEPASYHRLLSDIAAAGCVVVFPVYAEWDWSEPNFWPDRWYANALERTRAAVADVHKGRVGWWRPRLENLALIGHSLGGTYGVKMADEASDPSLPVSRRLPVAPKLIVLHDAAGLDTLPWTAPQPYDLDWFEDLQGIRDDASLVVIGSIECVIAHLFENDINATGVWSRAWNRSGPLAWKRGYVAYGGHFDVYGVGDYELYRKLTISALKSKFVKPTTADPAPDRRIDSWLEALAL